MVTVVRYTIKNRKWSTTNKTFCLLYHHYTLMIDTPLLLQRIFKNICIMYGLQCNTIREFDTAYTIKMFNYADVYRYYEDASLSNKLHQIHVPCLCLSAADDPFLYLRGKPVSRSNVTKNYGVYISMRIHHSRKSFWFTIEKNILNICWRTFWHFHLKLCKCILRVFYILILFEIYFKIIL